MKRLNYILIFFAIFTNYMFSQLDIGVHAGLVINSGKFEIKYIFMPPLYPEPTSRYNELGLKSLSTFSFGGLIETKLYSFLYFQTEVNYSDKRTIPRTVATDFFGGMNWAWSDYVEYSFKYIEVPLLLKMKFDYNKILPYCFAGIGIGLLYKATEKFYGYGSIPPYSLPSEYSISEFTKYEQPFVTFGIGTDYLLSDMCSVFITMRYSNSFVDIAKSQYTRFIPHNYDILLGIKTRIINY